MQLQECLEEYKALKDYWAPDYKSRNKALISFKLKHRILSDEHVTELKKLLETEVMGPNLYFVADLLYLYRGFSSELFEPMINHAILCRDPSLNRIFLRPCAATFGWTAVADLLTEKFIHGDILVKLGITSLYYWIWPKNDDDHEAIQRLAETIVAAANQSTNLVEIYLYGLRFKNMMSYKGYMPDGATDLLEKTKGIQECEELLLKLGWIKMLSQAKK